MSKKDPHDFTSLTAGIVTEEDRQKKTYSGSSSQTDEQRNTASAGGHCGLCRFLMAVGSVITFARNLVFNTIFVLLVLAVFGAFSLMDSIEKGDTSFTEYDEDSSVIHPLVMLRLDGKITEMPESDDDYTKLVRSLNENIYNVREHNILNIEKALKAAEENSSVKALFVDVSDLAPVSLNVAVRIRNAIESFAAKKGDKSVTVFSRYFTPAGYLIATGSKKIVIDPLGGFAFKGFSTSQFYISDMLERFRIEPLVFRAGAYKSAVEPLISNHMSPEVKQEYQHIFDSMWDMYLFELSSKRPATGVLRHLYSNQARYLTALKQSGSEANILKKYSLVSNILNEQQLKFNLIKTYGRSRSSYYEPLATDYRKLVPIQMKSSGIKPAMDSTKATIAVIYGIDEITDTADEITAFTPASIRSQLSQAAEDPNLKGVILYLNSGGGSVTASEDIRVMIESLKRRGIQVYVSMNSVAASGAYWIATAANRLYATEYTLTGSIGVFAVSFTPYRLLNEYGVYEDGVHTNELEMGSLGRAMPESQKLLYTAEVESIYRKFISLVKKSRVRMAKASSFHEFAEGRVFTAEDAQSLHMIDGICDLDGVIAEMTAAVKKGPVQDVTVKHLAPKAKDGMGIFRNLLTGSVASYIPNRYLKAMAESLLRQDSAKAASRPVMMAITPYEVKF